MDENTIISDAASTDVAASYNDEDFISGFSEAFGINKEEEKTEDSFVEDESNPQGETETEESEESTEEENTDGEEEKAPEMITFKEHGKEFSAPKEAVEAFATAVGRDAASIIDIYQKGCNYDALMEKLNEAKKDSEAFEKIALSKNVPKEQVRNEIIATLEKAKTDRVKQQILSENPGISEATAEELAKFRLEKQQPKAEEQKVEDNSEETAARLREIQMFQAKHPELKELPNEVIELWKKSGISLEKAFEGFQNENKVAELEKEIAELKKQITKKEQKNYAKDHSAGSANSAAGKEPADPFVEGLFASY